MPYHPPHKFRHGNAVYSLKIAKDISALKAVSQNLLHKNLSITDSIYGILSDTDLEEQIRNLGRKNSAEPQSQVETLIQTLRKAVNELEGKT